MIKIHLDDLIFHWKEQEPVQVPNLTLPRFRLHELRTYQDDRKTVTGIYSSLKADFVLKRNFSYYMSNLYIPCIMLVIVSQVNFYIDENGNVKSWQAVWAVPDKTVVL